MVPQARPPGRLPRPWGLVSSTAAPVLLVGGWTVGAALQPGAFDPVRRTISELAAADAAYPGVMTAALLGTGLCHVATAASLRPVRRGGRVVLAVGGVATAAVAAFPLPAQGSAPAHAAAAGVAFAALAAWPLVAGRRGAPTGEHANPLAGVVLTGLVIWFAVELVAGGPRVGLAERMAAGAQALWPLVVVWTAAFVGWRHQGRSVEPASPRLTPSCQDHTGQSRPTT